MALKQLDELSRVLGGIEKSLGIVMQTQAEDRMAAASYRTDIRKDLAGTRDDVSSLKGDIRTAKQDIAEMKPKVVSLEQRQLMSAGAATLAIWLGRVAYAVSAILGGLAAVLISRWTGK